jgi:hypothetical protein
MRYANKRRRQASAAQTLEAPDATTILGHLDVLSIENLWVERSLTTRLTGNNG